MVESAPPSREADARERTRRDVERLRRRKSGESFWRSFALIGSVGWPIVLLAVGGAMLGRLLDAHWGTGVHCTLVLLTVGAALGSALAYRTLGGGGA
jgi:predicted F0F1-ATPase subunit